MLDIPFVRLGIILLVSATFLCSCDSVHRKYKVGVVLYHQFSWREKLANEISYASYMYEDIDVTIVSSNNSSARQVQQIDSLRKSGIDLLIISPISAREVCSAINHCYDSGIPVVFVDNKEMMCRYTAYIGADNYEIGRSVGEYIGRLLPNGGNVLEVQGKAGDIATIERHNGFMDAIKNFRKVVVVGSPYGDWLCSTANIVVEKELEHNSKIDVLFYHSDGMFDYSFYHYYKSCTGHEKNQIKVIGIDALSKNPSGIDRVMKGHMTASFIYPTRGDEVLDLAVRILKRRPFNAKNVLPTGVVDKNNTSTILQQRIEIDELDSQIKSMRSTMDYYKNQTDMRGRVSILLAVLLLLLVFLCVTIYRWLRKSRLMHSVIEMQSADKELQIKHLAESNRLLVAKVDSLLACNSFNGDSYVEEKENVNSTISRDSEFLKQFHDCIAERCSDPDFCVSVICESMHLSRSKLYAKVKNTTGLSPVEHIRNIRLEKSCELLSRTRLNVAEVGYQVGFSSPAYFTKCFKDKYGVTPNEFRDKGCKK